MREHTCAVKNSAFRFPYLALRESLAWSGIPVRLRRKDLFPQKKICVKNGQELSGEEHKNSARCQPRRATRSNVQAHPR